jgi:hypothetical protein
MQLDTWDFIAFCLTNRRSWSDFGQFSEESRALARFSLESPSILGQNVEKCAIFAQFSAISLDFGRSVTKAPIFAQLLSAFALGAPIFKRGASLCSPISNAAFSFPLSLFPFSVFHLSLSGFSLFSSAAPTSVRAAASARVPFFQNFFPCHRIQPLPLPPTLCRRARRARPC